MCESCVTYLFTYVSSALLVLSEGSGGLFPQYQDHNSNILNAAIVAVNLQIGGRVLFFA